MLTFMNVVSNYNCVWGGGSDTAFAEGQGQADFFQIKSCVSRIAYIAS